MSSIGFDGFPQHRIIHRRLLERLGAHRSAVAEAGRADEELFAFLKHWLASHICGIDTKYAQASKHAVAAGR